MTYQNPYNYMSKDWSADPDGWKRLIDNELLNIVLSMLHEDRNPSDDADDKVRILYHKMIHRPIKW